MNLYLSPQQGHKEVLEQLKAELTSLRMLLELSGGIRVDALFPLPLRKKDGRASLATMIEIQKLEGDELTAKAVESLCSITRVEDQDVHETLRVPGACALSDMALEKLNFCNQLRMELIRLGQQVPVKDRRNLWKNARLHDGRKIAALQALRIPITLFDPQKIRFYWDIGESVKRYTAGELADEWAALLRSLDPDGIEKRAEDYPEDSTNFKVALSLAAIRREDSNVHVAIRRYLPPQVRARVRDGDDKPFITSASSPFVYSSDSSPPSVTPLMDYDPNGHATKKKPSTRIKLESEPFIPDMNVYRYMKHVAAMGPVVRKNTRNSRKKPN